MSSALVRLAAAVALVLSVAACGSGPAAPVVSFDPAGACTTGGQQPGAYPELEAVLPKLYLGEPPTNLDSGRTCTSPALGTLAGHGISDVKFAGATWKTGGASGFTTAVFQADGLDATTMIEFYKAGASAARRTDKLQVTEITVADQPGKRLDVLGTDGTGQTVVVWPAPEPGRVHVLLLADLGDAKVTELLGLFGTR